jgi:DNA polymerase III sliding clamp (beta) subunit (PCNA family)
MKLIVNTKALAKELEYVEKPLKLFTPDLLLKFILFEAIDNKLTLTTTNGLTLLTRTVLDLEETVKEPTAFVIPGSKLKDMVKLIDLELVTFSITDKTITMSAGKSKYRFNTTELAIPKIQAHADLVVEGETFTANASKFAESLKVASGFSAKDEQSQYTLKGVELVVDEVGLTARASDGHRAAEIHLEDAADGRSNSVFLMSEGISAVSDIVTKDTDQILTVVKAANRYRFECGSRRADVQRVNVEKFPAIEKVFASCEANEIFAKTDVKAFSLAVQRMQTAAAGSFNKIIVTIEDGKVLLHMAGFGDSINEASEEVEAVTNGTGKCSLNVGYIMDYVKQVSGIVDIRVGETGPALLKNGSLRCMILQMQ